MSLASMVFKRGRRKKKAMGQRHPKPAHVSTLCSWHRYIPWTLYSCADFGGGQKYLANTNVLYKFIRPPLDNEDMENAYVVYEPGYCVPYGTLHFNFGENVHAYPYWIRDSEWFMGEPVVRPKTDYVYGYIILAQPRVPTQPRVPAPTQMRSQTLQQTGDYAILAGTYLLSNFETSVRAEIEVIPCSSEIVPYLENDYYRAEFWTQPNIASFTHTSSSDPLVYTWTLNTKNDDDYPVIRLTKRLPKEFSPSRGICVGYASVPNELFSDVVTLGGAARKKKRRGSRRSKRRSSIRRSSRNRRGR